MRARARIPGCRSRPSPAGTHLPNGIAVEHLLSRVACVVLEEVERPAEVEVPEVLLVCVPGEEHDLPLVALGAALAERGVSTAVPGSRFDRTEDLAATLSRHRPRVAVVHMHTPGWADAPICIGWAHPDCTLVASGSGWELDRLPPEIPHTNNLTHAVDTVEGLLARA